MWRQGLRILLSGGMYHSRYAQSKCVKGRKGADALDGICSQAELEKSQANVPNVAIASFTLNKALQHVVTPTLQQNDVARFPSKHHGGHGDLPWYKF